MFNDYVELLRVVQWMNQLTIITKMKTNNIPTAHYAVANMVIIQTARGMIK